VQNENGVKLAGSPKPTFASILEALPPDFREEVIETDLFLKALRPLKMKRMVEKHGTKITYVASEFGVSYALRVSPGEYAQIINWYIVYNGKAETWHRKADNMEETLAETAKNDPRRAAYIFQALQECNDCHGERCLVKTPYRFNGQGKLTCHGRVKLPIGHADFEDARAFMRDVNTVAARRIANGTPLEKIILVNTKRSL